MRPMSEGVNTWIQKMERSLRTQNLLAEGDRVVVAVSGGADSVALLRLLKSLAPRLKLRLIAAHLHHGLRGTAAEADVRFVQALCRRLRVPCVIGRVDVKGLARRRRVSIEMAAREARYAFFVRTAGRVGASVVATAHTADDVAETLILRLARGAALGGLGAIRSQMLWHGVRFVRPLLATRREALLAFLKHLGQPWREDVTNVDPRFLRNRVRHEILPFLEQRLNPSLRETLRRTAEVLRCEDEWLDSLGREVLGACRGPNGLDVGPLRGYPLAARRRALLAWLRERGLRTEAMDLATLDAVERLTATRAGSQRVTLPEGWVVERVYDILYLHRLRSDREPKKWGDIRVPLRIPGQTDIPDLGLSVNIRNTIGIVHDDASRPGVFPARVSLCAARVKRGTLFLRLWRPGDRMRPLGLKGTRKLQDIFVDLKVPKSERHRLAVLECEHEIVWVPGYRIAEGWEVHPITGEALEISIRRLRQSAKHLEG